MMQKNEYWLIYSEQAISHLERIAVFLTKNAGAQIAFDINNALMDNIDKLSELPHLGSPHPVPVLAQNGYFALFIGRYVCIYYILGKTITIAGIYHQRTDWINQFNPINES